MSTSCTMDQRSARGYCPDEAEGHLEELCSLGIANDLCPDVEELCTAERQDAPYCQGPSDQGSDLLDEVATCETDGTCDDGFASECPDGFDYEAGACATVETAPPAPSAELPAAGLDGTLVLALGIIAIVGGLWLIVTHR